jgi:hypothetical protein
MPRSPRGEKRPADVIGDAVHAIRTGEIKKEIDEPTRTAAAELGRRGGQARAKAMSPEQRSEIARKAALARYSKRK